MYGHAGSKNHGCEALVRTTAAFLRDFAGDKPIKVVSAHPDEDRRYIKDGGIEFLLSGRSLKKYERIPAKALRLVTGSYYIYDSIEQREIVKNIKNSLCFSIGGDNYCYPAYENFMRMNANLIKNGCKTVLWGCSVEPERLKAPGVDADMRSYSLITARESATYEAMRGMGLHNVMFCPDTAFLLGMEETELPDIFANDAVGINISPMAMDYEKNGGATMKNYERLVEFILRDTDMNIALIPHVQMFYGDDTEPLRVLFDKYGDGGRMALIGGDASLNCMQLKYIISKCRFMVTARTHASIAAYSACVPTLVAGYSVKARGIARDIFSTEEHYVRPVQGMESDHGLLDDFIYIIENENAVKARLAEYNADIGKYYDDVRARVAELFDPYAVWSGNWK